jgi:broad specificity phosphatase PhoE
MNSEIFGTASIGRHGATRYTERFPDLAPEGLSRLREVGAQIVERSQGKTPVFVSSPAVRARGTVCEHMRAFGLEPDQTQIHQLNLLRTVDQYDQEAFMAHVRHVTGHLTDALEIHREWDAYYLVHSAFRNGLICESLECTKSRFIQFLRGPLTRLCAHNQGWHIVVVTHIELLGAFLQDHFDMKHQALEPAEVAHVTVMRGKRILIEFRGQNKLITKETFFPFTYA